MRLLNLQAKARRRQRTSSPDQPEINIFAGLLPSFLKECGDRHVSEHPRCGNDTLLVNHECDFAFENVEAFFFPAMNMRWRSAARRNDGFPHGIFAIGFISGHQEAVHVTDNGNGAAFCWIS